MTIAVNISSEVQAELARQAAAQGRAIEAYAASLLEEAVHLPAGAGRLSQDRLQNTLREMAEFSHKILSLPDGPASEPNFRLRANDFPGRWRMDLTSA